MKKILYTVVDKASNTSIPPFTFDSDRDATESFKLVCNDEKTNYFKYPEDFALHSIGEYDTLSLKLTSYERPQHIIDATKLVNKGTINEEN